MQDPVVPPSRTPPRFVPTLTEVVQLTASVPTVSADTTAIGLAPPVETARFDEQMVHRVMQRIDATLSQTLTQAVDGIVQAHVQLLEPLLRDEIEGVVRRVVSAAIAHELDEKMG